MDEKLTRIESKIDKLDSRLDIIDITTAKQEINIHEHIRRTNLLEERVEQIREELKPVEIHVHYMHGTLKAIGVLSLLIGIAVAIKELLS